MAAGRGRAGPAARATETRRGLRRGGRYIAQPRRRVRVVPTGGAGPAGRPSAPGAIRIRACRLAFDPGANRQGETLCAELDAKAADGSSRSFTRTSRRKRRAMKGWFVPPIVIPILIVVSLLGYASFRAFL